jgi:hypothetical protein
MHQTKAIILLSVWVLGCGSGSDAPSSAPSSPGGGGASPPTGAGPGNSGGATPPRGSGGGSSCDHLVASGGYLFATGLAAYQGNVFLAHSDAKARVIMGVQGDKLVEVARVPTDDTLIPGQLEADAFGFLLEIKRNNQRWIVRVPPDGSVVNDFAQIASDGNLKEIDFVADADHVYYEAPQTGYVERLPRAGGAAVQAQLSNFWGDAYETKAIDDKNVYSAVPGTHQSTIVYQFAKAAVSPDEVAPDTSVTYDLGTCDSAPGSLVTAGGQLYLGCHDNGAAMGRIFRLPAAPDKSSVKGEQLFAEKGLAYDTFIAAGDSLYVYLQERGGVFRIPTKGGNPVKVLGSLAVDRMTSDGQSLFTVASCGVSKAPL